jgi:hypothetical protein
MELWITSVILGASIIRPEASVRTFSCFVTDERSSTPTLSFILAATEQRARELARRELLDALRPVSVEIREGGKLLWTEATDQAEQSRTAG